VETRFHLGRIGAPIQMVKTLGLSPHRRGNDATRVMPAWMTTAMVLIIVAMISATVAAAEPARYVPGEILVKFRSDASAQTINKFHARMNTAVKRKSQFTGIRLLSLPSGLSVEAALRAYRSQPEVVYAEPNYIRRASATFPNDARFDEQWSLYNTGQIINTNPPFRGSPGVDIRAPDAWEIIQRKGRDPGVTPDGTPLIVAVIDSGVDYTHPDLLPNIWANAGDSWSNPEYPSTGNGVDDDGNGYPDDFHGWNFVGTQDNSACPVTCDCSPDDPVGNNDPMDDFGHGTHVAGITAAVGNNHLGISGVLWKARIMPLKILDANGCGSVGDEIQAIDYAINHGARVINASFGAPGLSSSEEEAIRASSNAGIVFVAAAGNESSDNDKLPIYPASFDLPNVISVAATDSNDRLSPVSNFGKNRVAIAAPGDCVFSTTPQRLFTLRGENSCTSRPITSVYGYITGTSMAAPHVSGVAGLLLSQDPTLLPEEIRAVILLTADPIKALKGRVTSSGRLNAYAALQRIKGSGLIGGNGGCGFPIGRIGRADPAAPTIGILLFLLTVFWPLLIPVIRKYLNPRRPLRIFKSRSTGFAFAAGLLALIVFWPDTAGAVDESPSFQPVHSFGVKFGYHRYDRSEYFDTNSGLLSRSNLAGLSEELEYDWRWRGNASLSVTAGRYRSRSDLRNVCCSSLSFSTNYLLMTPKYYTRIKFLEWYIGGGVGYYAFTREFHGLLKDRLSANVAGIHAVLGLQWPILRRVLIYTEARYALAKVKHADVFNDALDVGGLNYSFGVRWRFSAAGRSEGPAE
jgi:subtilisin family serine protease